MLKAHKYWSIGSLVCMAMCMYSGINMKSKDAHKYFAAGALGCMIMAMYTGNKMVSGKPKKKMEKADETDEAPTV